MKEGLYRSLKRKIITLTLVMSLTPLLILGGVFYYQFESAGREMTREQIRYRAQAQAEAVDLFLKERTAILNAMADTHDFEQMIDETNLARIFEVMNNRAGAFVDLGIIDSRGVHRAYIGPYDLRGRNYLDQSWFYEIMIKGHYKSDVYMGFRQQPHFIIAVRRHENQRAWILRATIDPNRFEEIVRSAQIGRTGDAYQFNREGVFQTRPRFDGNVLGQTTIDTWQFGGWVVERARKVVHNMLCCARKMEPRLEDVDVNSTIDQTITILENHARINNIDIQVDLGETVPIIAGDQAQLQQVFLNLITNAIDAIGSNGAIEVASWRSDDHIVVTIKDDGPGLSEDMMRKIFDPFFTTKDPGKGTGLGLWVSHSIIAKMGGGIHVKNNPHKGAIFTVGIPIVIPEKK